MTESILADVRSACNLDSMDKSFDKQLIPLVNAQIMMAHQFGVGRSGFRLTGDTEDWGEWLGPMGNDLEAIKIWLGYSVLLLFDPPDNSTVLRSYQDQIQKMEWMLKEKSEEKGYVRYYVPEQRDFYLKPKRIANTESDEDEDEDGFVDEED